MAAEVVVVAAAVAEDERTATVAAVGVEEAVEEADSVEEAVAALAEDLKDAVGAVVVLKPTEVAVEQHQEHSVEPLPTDTIPQMNTQHSRQKTCNNSTI
jgi:hypothetical protein